MKILLFRFWNKSASTRNNKIASLSNCFRIRTDSNFVPEAVLVVPDCYEFGTAFSRTVGDDELRK